MKANEAVLINIINGLVTNIRAKHKIYGNEYQGGMPLQFALKELQDIGIIISENGEIIINKEIYESK